MQKVINVLVLVLVVAVIVLAVMLKNVSTSTARIEHYITKDSGLAAWMRTQPDAIRGRLSYDKARLTVLCEWAAKNAPANLKCPPEGPGGTGDPPTSGPKWP